MADAIARLLLANVVEVLEADPRLAERLRAALGGGPRADEAETVELRQTGMPVRSLRAAVLKGELVAVKIGRSYRVRRTDLAAWVAGRKVEPTAGERRPKRQQSAAERAIERARAAGRLRAIAGGGGAK